MEFNGTFYNWSYSMRTNLRVEKRSFYYGADEFAHQETQ